jgi:hypothetical protein
MDLDSMLCGKEGPFSEFEIIVEKKNGDRFEGCAFEKDYKELTDTISNGIFLRFIIFQDNAFPIIHIAMDEIAVIYIKEKQRGIYLASDHLWLDVIKDENEYL